MEASPGMYKMKIGTKLPSFSLRGVDGRTYTPADFAEDKVLIVAFTCNHCPYVQAHEERLIALQKQYGPQGAQLICINSNDEKLYPDDSFEKMWERAQEKRYNFPYLHDFDQRVARAFSALCTPEFFVFGKDRTLAYHGRFDDNWQNPEMAMQHYLAHAIEALLEGKKPDLAETPVMGCSIKWSA